MIMYFAVFNREGWDWIFVVPLHVPARSIRLARFNVEQAGRAKNYFHGLPSPAAGMTLATYYWFSQTPAVQPDNPWRSERGISGCAVLMLALAFLMISNVSYPAVPTSASENSARYSGHWSSPGPSSESSFFRRSSISRRSSATCSTGWRRLCSSDLLGKLPSR